MAATWVGAASGPAGSYRSRDLVLLVISANGSEAALGAIRKALDYLGTPHDVLTASTTDLNPERLASGLHAHYSGVILVNDSVVHIPPGKTGGESALSAAEWETLRRFETEFGVRRLTWYAYPSPSLGFGSAQPFKNTEEITTEWTPEGRVHFPYLNTGTPFRIREAYGYRAPVAGAGSVPWLRDGAGNALIAATTYPDGRENLVLTFDSGVWTRHSTLLSHGLINWVSRGVFVGERHTYLSAHVDDVFLTDALWGGGEYRLDRRDWQAALDWQSRFRQRRSGGHFRLDMAFNGVGSLTGEFNPDTLTPIARATQAQFKWINHTFTHRPLNDVAGPLGRSELERNHAIADRLGLTTYSREGLVTPAITGLDNPAFMNAAYAAGVRYLVSDASIPSHRAPSPNTGLLNRHRPGILMIPRQANDLYYDVSTPEQWVNAYRARRGEALAAGKSHTDLINEQAEILLGRVLEGDVSPLMFHQSNLRAYDASGRSLLGELLDRIADGYERVYNFPFLSPTLDELGQTVRRRMIRNKAGLRATLNADGSVTLRSERACRAPITGLRMSGAEFYAGSWISSVDLVAGETRTVRAE